MVAKGYISRSSHQELNNHVDIKTYISFIGSFKYSRKDLDAVSAVAFLRFAVNKPTSAYQVFSYLDDDDEDFVMAYKKIKNKAHFLSYKNVHKKVQQLLSSGLIEIAKDKDTKHDAVYYKLSSYGLFYLIWKQSVFAILNGKKILKNYKNDKLFKLFLYPFLGDSMDQIQAMAILDYIFSYLNIVCNAIIETLDNFTSKKETILYSWKKLLASDDHIDILLDYLNLVLNLQWLDSEIPEVEKRERENMIKISGKEHSIVIRTDPKDKKKLIIIADAREVHEFTLRKDGLIIDNIPSTSDSGSEFYCQNLISLTNLEIPLLLMSIIGHFESEIDDECVTNDYVVFAKDKIFMHTLEIIKNKIVKHYEKLSGLAKLEVIPPITKMEPKNRIDLNAGSESTGSARQRRQYDLLERLHALNF